MRITPSGYEDRASARLMRGWVKSVKREDGDTRDQQAKREAKMQAKAGKKR